MRCPNCQKTILDNLKKCPYCGHETLKKLNVVDMFENTPASPMGGLPVSGAVPPAEHHEAVQTEVKKRHWQRWVFYALIIIIVVGSVGLMVKIYNDNTALLLTVSASKDELAKKSTELAAKNTEVQQVNDALKKAQDDLNQKAEQYKKDIEGQGTAVKDLEQCKLQLTSSDANIYNLILTLGTGISNADIARIPVADANLSMGVDGDQDGLSDEVEAALGTDITKSDTDGDGFSDKAEVLGGFDPLKNGGKMPIDTKYADQQKGRIILAVDGNKDAWYVNPADGKRYFLGRPGDAYKAMRSVEFWTKNYKAQ